MKQFQVCLLLILMICYATTSNSGVLSAAASRAATTAGKVRDQTANVEPLIPIGNDSVSRLRKAYRKSTSLSVSTSFTGNVVGNGGESCAPDSALVVREFPNDDCEFRVLTQVCQECAMQEQFG